MTGKIARLVIDKGFGFVEADGQDFFFHHSAVRGAQFADLREGQPVRFDASAGAGKGPRAENVVLEE